MDTITTTSPPADALSVVHFWRDAGPTMWFAKDADFDRRFRERFHSEHEAAARQELIGWLATARRAGLGAVARPVPAQRLPRHATHVRDG